MFEDPEIMLTEVMDLLIVSVLLPRGPKTPPSFVNLDGARQDKAFVRQRRLLYGSLESSTSL